ncbi:MAG: ectonucleotide pyrophosphatase/phosphodiesterase, partial [Fidelibacterota bacterium]
ETPNLDALAASGVRAEALIPVFPSKTFPNHLTMVTGLYPEHHGIVSNTMYDDQFDAWYFIGPGSEPVRESRWYEGEPIWVTAEKQDQTTASYFWPASEVEIGGVRPTYWYTYDGSVPNEDRVKQVVNWLDLPDSERPTFITLYFGDTDSWGHTYGPDAPEMETVIRQLDATVGNLMDSLEERDLLDEVNVLVTSDHGMVETSRDSIIFLDDYISVDDIMVVDWSPVAMIRPSDGMEDTIYNVLKGAHPRLTVYRKEEIPQRFHYRDHRRITPIIAIASEGWSITTHGYFDSHPTAYTGGDHGYDNQLKSMGALFIASGPALKDGLVVRPFQNIHLYELICHILSLQSLENDGSLDSVMVMLER